MNNKDEIITNLWVGNLPRHLDGIDQFKFVICLVGTPFYNIGNKQIVVVAPFDDSPTLPSEDFLETLADLTVDFCKKGSTLVHCMSGINRSSMIVALALVKLGYSGKQAIDLIRSKRGDDVLSNEVFRKYIEGKD